jgi:hypothetical protein
MLTRRIGLEPMSYQRSAPAHAYAPSGQGMTQDEKGAGPFSTD